MADNPPAGNEPNPNQQQAENNLQPEAANAPPVVAQPVPEENNLEAGAANVPPVVAQPVPEENNLEAGAANVPPVVAQPVPEENNVEAGAANVPPVVANQQQAENNQVPAAADVPPVVVDQLPAENNPVPAEADVQPVVVDQVPAVNNQVPVAADVQPVVVHRAPVAANVQPGVVEHVPAEIHQQPLVTNVQSVAAQQKRTGKRKKLVAAPAIYEEAEITPEYEQNHDEFDRYLAMCKTLTLQLPFERDRVIASKWVKKINTSEDNIKERLSYLKLLCVSMLSHRLVGPFKHVPNDEPSMDEICNVSRSDIIRDIAQETTTFKTDPYYVEISGDLKEYVAYQEIPNFGAHFYYAFSNETILNWRNDQFAILPSGGLNYPILSPPLERISKSAKAYKDAYKKYTAPEPTKRIPPNKLPNLVHELNKRKIIQNEEISRMGTKKLISKEVKTRATPNVNRNPQSSALLGGQPVNKSAVSGRPACGNRPPTQGRVPACVAVRQSRTS